jgi:hypothetical protein
MSTGAECRLFPFQSVSVRGRFKRGIDKRKGPIEEWCVHAIEQGIVGWSGARVSFLSHHYPTGG